MCKVRKIYDFQGERKMNRKEYLKNYYQENKERIKEHREKQGIKKRNKKTAKEYYQKNKEQISIRKKEYYYNEKNKPGRNLQPIPQ